ncbi:MAG TPA: polysaccharide biosynthesis protein, partial [Rhodopila sp.]
MAAARSWIRIAVNVALDGGMAALSVPVARWLADPAAPALHPLWTIPLGAVTLLLAGIPFRLSLQFWRFTAIGDVLTVAASAAAGAILFAVTIALTIGELPNPTFPAIHALTLLLFLGAPRVIYRWRRGRPAAKPDHLDAASILLVGSIEDADLFIRALTQDRRQAFRVEGLLASSDRQTGRRIQGHRILGSLNDAATVLAQLQNEDRLPGTLVFVTPELSGARLAQVVTQADHFGLQVRQAPRPTALADPDKPRPVELRPVAIEDLLNRP